MKIKNFIKKCLNIIKKNYNKEMLYLSIKNAILWGSSFLWVLFFIIVIGALMGNNSIEGSIIFTAPIIDLWILFIFILIILIIIIIILSIEIIKTKMKYEKK